MPVTAHLSVASIALRPGDRFAPAQKPHVVEVASRAALIAKGRNKGRAQVPIVGASEPLVYAPDEQVVIERDVPTQQERDAYLAADKRFRIILSVVEAREAFNRAAATLQSGLARATSEPLPGSAFSHGPGLCREAGEVESTAARLTTLWEVHRPVLMAEGYDLERINEVAQQNMMARDLYEIAPTYPRNADCFLDGTPAPGSNSVSRVVRASREEQETERKIPSLLRPERRRVPR